MDADVYCVYECVSPKKKKTKQEKKFLKKWSTTELITAVNNAKGGKVCRDSTAKKSIPKLKSIYILQITYSFKCVL